MGHRARVRTHCGVPGISGAAHVSRLGEAEKWIGRAVTITPLAFDKGAVLRRDTGDKNKGEHRHDIDCYRPHSEYHEGNSLRLYV